MIPPFVSFALSIVAFAAVIFGLSFLGFWIEELLDRLGDRLFHPKPREKK